MPLEIKEIEEKGAEFKDIFDRNDSDMDLHFHKKFEMLGFDKRPIPKIVNLTLPDAALFSSRSIAILQGAEPQTVVSGNNLTDKFTHHIEEFSEDLFISADERLGFKGIQGIYPYEVEQSCVRGRLNAWSLIRVVNGKVVIDIRPTDSRYQIYDMGQDGFNWACYISNQSRTYIKEAYKKDIGDELFQVQYDAYSRDRHRVWIGTGESAELVDDTAHPFKYNGVGYVPLVMQKVPAGSMLAHPDAVVHDGESIFALGRDLYPELNRMATVLHNLTMASFFGARQYASEAGEEKETEAIPFGLGVVVSIEKGGGYTLIPVNDIKNATRLEYSMIESRLQRASLPAIDYGNLTFPLSAVAIGRLTESKDQIFIPRLQALAWFYQKLIRMAIKQVIAAGMTVELGEEGHRREYLPSELEGQYSIKQKYYADSKEQKLANITEAMSMGKLVSEDYKRREIIKLVDPEGEADKIRDEQAEAVDPAIGLYRRCHSLVDKKKDVEAKMTLKALIMVLKQRAMQRSITFPPQQEGKEEQPTSAMPLISGERGQGQGERATKSEEQRASEEMDEEERIARLAETGRKGREAPALTETGG